jgi:hypothetical protein
VIHVLGRVVRDLCPTLYKCDPLLGMSVFSCVLCLLPFDSNIKIVIKSDVYELPLPSSVKPGLGNYCTIVHQINFVLPRLLEIYIPNFAPGN